MKLSTKLLTIALTSVLTGPLANAFTEIDSGAADSYFCSISSESSTEPGTYDDNIYTGFTELNDGSDYLFLSLDGKVVSEEFDKMNPTELTDLNGATMIAIYVTPEDEADEMDRNLSISLNRVSVEQDSSGDDYLLDTKLEVLASGYHKASVLLIDVNHKIAISCMPTSHLSKSLAKN